MNKTGIEYAQGEDGKPGYGWNFFPGCLHKRQGKCPLPNCWAEGTWPRVQAGAKKRGVVLPDFTEPHLIPERLLAPLSRKKPSRILVNFMGDLMGDWVDPEKPIGTTVETALSLELKGYRFYDDVPLRRIVFEVMEHCPQHQFLFLTKNPAGYEKWGEWPDNAWLGATVCDADMLYDACDALHWAKAKHKWLSIEPLYGELNGGECEGERLDMLRGLIKWVVIGGQTRPNVMPEIEWISEIISACDKINIPVWLKNNLKPLFDGSSMMLRQELPV